MIVTAVIVKETTAAIEDTIVETIAIAITTTTATAIATIMAKEVMKEDPQGPALSRHPTRESPTRARRPIMLMMVPPAPGLALLHASVPPALVPTLVCARTTTATSRRRKKGT
jgi:hypothetical protein